MFVCVGVGGGRCCCEMGHFLSRIPHRLVASTGSQCSEVGDCASNLLRADTLRGNQPLVQLGCARVRYACVCVKALYGMDVLWDVCVGGGG